MKLFKYLPILILWISQSYVSLSQQAPTKDADCFPFLEMVNDTLYYGNYNSSSTIISNSAIAQNATVSFKAGEGITLSEGFSTAQNSEFTASIEDCDANMPTPIDFILADRFGNVYESRTTSTDSNTRGNGHPCMTCGHFTLEFFDSNGNGFDDPILGTSRQQVLCDVFMDLTALINSPIPSGGVLIEVHESTSYSVPNYPNNQETLATATGYHLLSTNDGIDDNGVWRTLMTGEDAWTFIRDITNVTWPHGSVQVNFDSNKPYVYNDVDRNTCVGSSEYDFYTILLHEALHAIGLYSLVDGGDINMVSHMTDAFGRFQHFYNRYDLDIHSNNTALIKNPSPFNVDPDTGLDLLPCSAPNNINYTGQTTSNQSIFTGVQGGSWWDSSLSHLNCTTHPDYVMNPSYNSGTAQRAPHPNEVNILSDLGYSVNNTFGALVCPSDPYCTPLAACNQSDHIPSATYNIPTANQICHIGRNDQYTGAVAGDPLVINANGTDGYLSNDVALSGVPALTLDHLHWDPNHGTVTISNNDITFTPYVTFSGWTYIIYVVDCNTSQQSNMTYITIEVLPAALPPLPTCAGTGNCQNGSELLCWGDFEDFQLTNGMYGQTPYPAFRLAGNGGNSVDICSENGTNNYANANLAVGEVIMLPLSSPLLPNCTATIEYSVGFNTVLPITSTSHHSGEVLMWMSEQEPCPIASFGLPNPIVNTEYQTSCGAGNIDITCVVNDQVTSPFNPKGVCLNNVEMSTYQISWTNLETVPMNFLYIAGRVFHPTNSGYISGFGKFDDISVSSNCPPNEISVTSDPTEVSICENGSGSIEYTICNDPSSQSTSTINYTASANTPAFNIIDFADNNWFETDGTGDNSLNIAPGICTTITLLFDSDLDAGDLASIQLDLNSDDGCVTAASDLVVPITVDSEIQITADPLHMILCPGEMGEIQYTICNHSAADITLDYEEVQIAASNGLSTIANTWFDATGQATSPLDISAGNCENMTYQFNHNLLLGEHAIAVFRPLNEDLCIATASSVWTNVTSSPNISVATTPTHLDLCNGNSATINYTVCNLSPDPISVPYTIEPSGGINCISHNCNDVIMIDGGKCKTIVAAVESSLPVGEPGEVEFDITSTDLCLASNSEVITTVDTPKEISVQVSPTNLSLCPRYTDEIKYEICNSNPADYGFDYNIMVLGFNADVDVTPQSGNLIVEANTCITHVVTVTNHMSKGGFANIRFIPDACLTDNSIINTNLTVPACAYLDSKIFIEDVDKQFNTNNCSQLEMVRDYDIPDVSPYPALGYAQVGGQTNAVSHWASGDMSIIDWVFVELRDAIDPSKVLHTRNALLLNNGSIIDNSSLSGQYRALAFHDIDPGDYYVAVRYRNHLDVMSDHSLSFNTGNTTVCDFTDGRQGSAILQVDQFSDTINCNLSINYFQLPLEKALLDDCPIVEVAFELGRLEDSDMDGGGFWHGSIEETALIQSISIEHSSGDEQILEEVYLFLSEHPIEEKGIGEILENQEIRSVHLREGLRYGVEVPVDFEGKYLRIQEAGEEGNLIKLDWIVARYHIPGTGTEDCHNGTDDDCDGLIDCADNDCAPKIYNVRQYDPSCAICSDGSIRVYASGFDRLYSIDGGVTWQSLFVFDNLLEGDYEIMVKNSVSNCAVSYANNKVSLVAPVGQALGNCANGGFESGDFTNWTGGVGTLPTLTFSNTTLNTSTAPEQHTILATPFVDPHTNITINSPGNGLFIAKLGNDTDGAEKERLTYSFIANPSNADFRFFFLPVFENPPNHTHTEQPFVQYRLYTVGVSGAQSDIVSQKFVSDKNDPFFDSQGNIVYTAWNCVEVDLNAYIGKEVFVEFINADCSRTGHWGYTYIDGLCLSDANSTPVGDIDVKNVECTNTGFVVDGSASYNENQYTWTVCKLDNTGNTEICLTESGYLDVGSIDLEMVFSNQGVPFECDKNYRITLETFNDCFPGVPVTKNVFVACGKVIEYESMLVCSDNNSFQLQGVNNCSNCTYDWFAESPVVLHNYHTAFPYVVSGAISPKDVWVEATDPATGCVYRDTATVMKIGDITITPSQTQDVCFTTLTAEIITSSYTSDLFDINWLQISNNQVIPGGSIQLIGSGNGINIYEASVDVNSEFDSYEFQLNIDEDWLADRGLDSDNCSYTELFTVGDHPSIGSIPLMYFPNTFTPNGDNINDDWIVFPPLTGYNVSWYKLMIFNRWGGLVYEKEESLNFSQNPLGFPLESIKWDGTWNGTPLNPEVYTYVLNFENCQNPRATANFPLHGNNYPCPGGEGSGNCWFGDITLKK